jgi:hypothetical protein
MKTILAAILALLLTGCASLPAPKPDTYAGPAEGNTVMTSTNAHGEKLRLFSDLCQSHAALAILAPQMDEIRSYGFEGSFFEGEYYSAQGERVRMCWALLDDEVVVQYENDTTAGPIPMGAFKPEQRM